IALLTGLSRHTLAGTVRPADNDVPPAVSKTTTSTWYNSWFGAKDKEADKKTSPRAGKDLKAEGTAAKAPPKTDRSTGDRAREQATLLRRLAVCDQLRLIATQKNDDDLLRLAEQLDERVWEVYTQRVAQLPAAPAGTGTPDLDWGKPPRSAGPSGEAPGHGATNSIRK